MGGEAAPSPQTIAFMTPLRAVAVLLSAWLLGSCTPPAATAPGRGGEIRVAISSDILSTNPGVLRDGNTDTVLYHIGESLVAYRDDMSVGPLLARTVALSEDRLTYTFTLRHGVRFHNGEPMTSAEVVWTWRRLLDPETGFRCLDDFDGSGASGVRIESITATAPDQVVFRLNRPSALFLDRMASIQCLTAILHPSSVDAAGAWTAPIGTGPYQLGEWRRGRSVTLERFDDYSPRSEPMSGLTGRKIAYARRLVFVVTPDRLSAKASLYAGAIDLVFAAPISAYGEMQRHAQRHGDVRVHRRDTLDWTVLLMQTRDPLLSDVRMRRAIAHALSPRLITDVSSFGLAQPNSSAVMRASRFYNARFAAWPAYDPALARRLAREAGYDGQVLTIQTNRKFPYMYDNAIAAQAMLTAAGFNVRLEVSDWATQLSQFQRGDFQLSAFGYSARSHPALMYATFTGSRDVRGSYQWEDPRALALVAQFEEVRDDAAMALLLLQLHGLMQEDLPMVGLYNDEIVDLSRTSLTGYAPWAMGRPRLWGVQTTRPVSAP